MSTTCLTSNCSDYMSGSLGLIFTSALQFLFAAQCGIRDKYPPDASDTIETMDMNFDYIVVGAGSAGSVVAARLSEDPCIKLLLLEAGGNPPFESEVPEASFNLQLTENDWQYYTESDPISHQGMIDSKCYWPAGKMLGGDSSLSENKHTRGKRKDFDDIEAAGNVGWNFTEALKYFKKSENLSDDYIKNNPVLSQYHNFSGPLGVLRNNNPGYIEDKLIKAYEQLGYKQFYDINGSAQYGVFRIQSTIQDGRVSNTARSFLSPARGRNNLVVLKHSLATKILFNGKTAIGINIKLKNGTEIQATATKEVVICAGAIRTPQLLMLSGIGPRKHLGFFNIPVISDLPVGYNLMDHVIVPVLVTISTDIQAKSRLDTAIDVVQYIASRSGYYSRQGDIGASIYAHINSDERNEKSEPPNIQIVHSAQAKNSSGNGYYCRTYSKYTQQICDSISSYNLKSSVITIYPALLNTYSRGNITLASTNASDYPKIYANSFHDIRDVNNLIKAIGIVMKALKTPSFKSIGAKVRRINITACNNYKFPSDDYWKCLIYQMGSSAYHVIGTAKMGPVSDQTAVVNPRLRVHGILNLRVVDASVIPSAIRGNTNAAVIMFAEKASDMIKEDHSNDPCHKETSV